MDPERLGSLNSFAEGVDYCDSFPQFKRVFDWREGVFKFFEKRGVFREDLRKSPKDINEILRVHSGFVGVIYGEELRLNRGVWGLRDLFAIGIYEKSCGFWGEKRGVFHEAS